jgi:poly(3-hydroxybutyrate) depolymerase
MACPTPPSRRPDRALRSPPAAGAALAAAFLVAACAPLAGPGAGEATVAPPPALHLDGVPPVPRALADATARYTGFRGHVPVAWHPTRPEMLVAFRKDGGRTVQLHRLAGPLATPEPVTDFDEPVTAGSWEPIGARGIVFERATGGDEAAQLHRLDLATGRTTLLSEPGQRHAFGAWLHGSNRFVHTSVPLDRTAEGGTRAQVTTRLVLVDPAVPEARRLVAELPGPGWFDPKVSWDDRRIAITRLASVAESEVWIVELDTGARRRLLPAGDGAEEKALHVAVGWRRDDRALVVLDNAGSEFLGVGVASLADGRRTRFAPDADADVDWDAVETDGRRVAVAVNAEGRGELRQFDLATGAELPRPAAGDGAGRVAAGGDGAGSVVRLRLHPTLPLLALGSTGATGPSRIAVLPLDGATAAAPAAWTRPLAAAGIDPAVFREQQVVRWTSFDGRSISGLLSRPPARFAGKRPVLVDIHGGPESQARVGFLNRQNFLVEELGIAVIWPNVRGSGGFGKTFLALDNGLRREDAVKDIGALFDWIAAQPDLDATRIAVSGGSYGGYMALAVATTYPTRIAGAIDVVGISDFTSFLRNTESYRRDLRRAEYGDERDPAMRAFFDRISPLRNAGRIARPLFVVHGRNDPRVPVSEAEQIVERARAAGATVWYLRADNEGHGFARTENADYLFFATVRFLQETLLR